MKLIRLQLVNVGPFRRFEHEFKPGVTAIIGENGSGKTMLFESVRWLLTGRFPHRAGKGAAVSQFIGTGETSYGTLQFEHGGVMATVTRYLRPDDRKSELQIGSVPYAGDKAIKLRLESFLDLDATTFDDIVMVAQENIVGTLAKSPAERAAVYQRLFRLQVCVWAYEELADQLAKYPAAAPTLDEVAVAEQQVAAATAALAKLPEDAHDLSALCAEREAARGRLEHLQRLLQQHMEYQGAKQALAAKAADVVTAEAELTTAIAHREAAEAKLAEHAASSNAFAVELAGLEPQIAAERARQKWREQLQSVTALRDQTRRQLAGYSVEADTRELERCRQEVATRAAAMAGPEAFIAKMAKLNDAPVCPTCGAATTTVIQQLADAKQTCARLTAEMQEWLTVSRPTEARLTEARRLQEQLTQIEYGVAAAQQALAAAGDVAALPEGAVERLAVLQQYKLVSDGHTATLTAAATAAKQAVSAAEQKVQRLRNSMQFMQGHAEALQQQLGGLPPPSGAEQLAANDMYTAACAAVDTVTAAREQRNRLQVDKQAAELALVSAQQRYQQGRLAFATREYLVGLRSVFHPDALPKVIVTRKLAMVEAAVNGTLAAFSVPFRMQAGNNYSVDAKFADGRVQAGTDLSGGQRVTLSLVLRISLNLRAAPGLAFIGLDEPTNWLDRRRVAALIPFFRTLQGYAAERGMQCLIVTHEQQLAPVFDDVINLGSTTG